MIIKKYPLAKDQKRNKLNIKTGSTILGIESIDNEIYLIVLESLSDKEITYIISIYTEKDDILIDNSKYIGSCVCGMLKKVLYVVYDETTLKRYTIVPSSKRE